MHGYFGFRSDLTPKFTLGIPAAFIFRYAVVVHADHRLNRSHFSTIMPFACLLR